MNNGWTKEVDRLRAINKDLLEAAKRSRKALAAALKANWEGSTDKDVSRHNVIKALDNAIAKAEA